MAARSPLALLSLFFLSGALLLMFFVVLAGTRDRNPLDQIYFLRADTSGIPNAPVGGQSRWTLWNYCGVTPNGRNDCGFVRPAYPFDPPRNFGTQENVPQQFIGDRTKKFFYLTRFMFAFVLIALFFAVLALFSGLLALFSRLGGAISGLFTSIALLFQTVVASLMTAAFVLGRKRFRAVGRDAHLGRLGFAFVWTPVACLLLSTILFFMVLATRPRDTTVRTRRSGGFFQRTFPRRRAARDRGSFIETESQRRVKDEYS